jgi:hypothetical protein
MADENTKPPENSGGSAGGSAPDEVPDQDKPQSLILRKSELAVLRRMANKYPIQPDERAEMVEAALMTMRRANSGRLKLSAIKALLAMDRANVDEIRTYAAVHENVGKDLQPANQTHIDQVNIILGQLTLEQKRALLEKHRAANRQLENGDGGPNGAKRED